MTRSPIDLTFTQLRDMDDALVRFCEALDEPKHGDPPIESLAREAYLSVLAFAQLIYGVHGDDSAISTLALT
ncbi:MAG TPA: hypothetical protein VFV99_13645, partial [Kofleriaceae bacterium]|nr:hypothetical protein [Kofleriaceae bacterium]